MSKQTDSAAEVPARDERVPLTVRLTRPQWRRVKNLALDEQTSVQDLAVRGLSKLLEERGGPAL